MGFPGGRGHQKEPSREGRMQSHGRCVSQELGEVKARPREEPEHWTERTDCLEGRESFRISGRSLLREIKVKNMLKVLIFCVDWYNKSYYCH